MSTNQQKNFIGMDICTTPLFVDHTSILMMSSDILSRMRWATKMSDARGHDRGQDPRSCKVIIQPYKVCYLMFVMPAMQVTSTFGQSAGMLDYSFEFDCQGVSPILQPRPLPGVGRDVVLQFSFLVGINFSQSVALVVTCCAGWQCLGGPKGTAPLVEWLLPIVKNMIVHVLRLFYYSVWLLHHDMHPPTGTLYTADQDCWALLSCKLIVGQRVRHVMCGSYCTTCAILTLPGTDCPIQWLYSSLLLAFESLHSCSGVACVVCRLQSMARVQIAILGAILGCAGGGCHGHAHFKKPLPS